MKSCKNSLILRILQSVQTIPIIELPLYVNSKLFKAFDLQPASSQKVMSLPDNPHSTFFLRKVQNLYLCLFASQRVEKSLKTNYLHKQIKRKKNLYSEGKLASTKNEKTLDALFVGFVKLPNFSHRREN